MPTIPYAIQSAAINFAFVILPVLLTVALLIRYIMARHQSDKVRSRYDEVLQEAKLAEVRASYERHIAELSREMVATKSKWEDANHLLVSGQRHQFDDIDTVALDTGIFLGSYGIDVESVAIDKDQIFVLTPFSDEEKPIFRVVKDVCDNAGFKAVRGDEKKATGDILAQVLEGIVSSRLIIANISSRNPNVFFELGIAMALGKPTLLISDTLSDIPFDVQGKRIVLFKNTEDLRTSLTSALLRSLREI